MTLYLCGASWQLADRLAIGPAGRKPGRALLFFLVAALSAQTFDVASVKPSAKPVGKDYNNQIAVGPSTFTAKNTTSSSSVAMV